MKSEIIEFEVEAPRALFSRVDSTGGFLQSYPVPTPTAVEGLCNAIVGIHRQRNTIMKAEYVKVCSPYSTGMETTNSYAVSRKQELITKQAAQQMRIVFLVNQKWIFGVRAFSKNGKWEDIIATQKMFIRYIEKGKCIGIPCLGHSEMFPSYIGPVREGTSVNVGVNHVIPDFLIRTFNIEIDGAFNPTYADLVQVTRGFLDYSQIRKDNNVL